MLKISQVGAANHSITLRLEGRVIGPWVGELRHVCEPLLGERCIVELDLAGVSYVDADGVVALASFKARGAELKNCSPFVGQQMKAEL